MPKAEIEAVVDVPKEKFFKAVTHYEAYPKIVDGFKSVEVTRKGPGQASVKYTFSVLLKKIVYTLQVFEEPEKGRLSWTLVSSDVFKVNNGEWTIVDAGGGKARVRYSLEAEFKVPVPEMILNQLLKGTMPSMVRSFEKHAKGL